jgi:hypothetical protein
MNGNWNQRLREIVTHLRANYHAELITLREWTIKAVVGVALVTLQTSGVLQWIGTQITRLIAPVFSLLETILSPYWTQLTIETSAFFATLGVGELLFMARCRHPVTYGRLEQLVALASALFAATQLFGYDPKNNIVIVVLFAQLTALYIYVRGKDNIYRGLKEATTPDKLRRKVRWDRIYFGIRAANPAHP